MKKLILIALISLLVACGTTKVPPQVVYVTQEVKVPVYTVPSFTIPLRPFLPIEVLDWSDIDDHNVIGKAYVKSLKIQDTHIEQLHNLLEGIKKGEDQ